MSDIEKIESATQDPAYRAYSALIGAAMGRLLLGDGSARREIADLQKEQAELVRNLMAKQS